MSEQPQDKTQKEFEDAIRSANPAQFPDFTEINQSLKKQAQGNTAHTPRQNGPYIICMSCGYRHTLGYIGTRKQLVGIKKNGEWILKDRF